MGTTRFRKLIESKYSLKIPMRKNLLGHSSAGRSCCTTLNVGVFGLLMHNQANCDLYQPFCGEWTPYRDGARRVTARQPKSLLQHLLALLRFDSLRPITSQFRHFHLKNVVLFPWHFWVL